MTTGTDYGKLYNQAYAAYGQGNYPAALALTEQMAEIFPDDAHLFLLQANIYYGLGQYDQACYKYESVLAMSDTLADQPQVLEYARQGLERAQQYMAQLLDPDLALAETEGIIDRAGINGMSGTRSQAKMPLAEEEEILDWEEEALSLSQDGGFNVDGADWDSGIFNDEDFGEPTIGKSPPFSPFSGDEDATSLSRPFNVPENNHHNPFSDQSPSAALGQDIEEDFSFDDSDISEKPSFSNSGEQTFMVSGHLSANGYPEDSKMIGADWDSSAMADQHTVQAPRPFELDSPVNSIEQEEGFWSSEDGTLDPDLEGFTLTDISEGLPDSGLFSSENKGGISQFSLDEAKFATQTSPDDEPSWMQTTHRSNGESSSISSALIKPTVEVKQGQFAWLLNAPLAKKQLMTAAAAGLISTLTVLLVAGGSALSNSQPKSSTPPQTETAQTQNDKKAEKKGSPILLMALLSGISSFLVTFILLEIIKRYIQRTIHDLSTQLDSLYQGNYNIKATVYGTDELGMLTSRFNLVARDVHTRMSEALARATEVEQAREDLQRQVIRLLDDVEGAARGDLTVEAEVTADVLGAVADAFNLTIQNLREIVKQVKKAALQVNKGSTDSELFARNNSGDALRMAEELAVTLQSVQMMTESIQRVADNAREAEEVAHSSSVTALKGGESVEQTVAGILQIRETVSDAARKVKRLAEASQEISKIVAVISQIASRTNLLALNASIQAARAGEAGKGFAIVADEVRQLADRSAKELKDIEQIVLQIQSETGSVMKAMDEGIQQVIKLTDMSEQSKRSLEDIIEVAHKINKLVQSITADTVKQRENSRAVAQVMQSVELTAQETSKESQRVAGSLQKLVSISRDLLLSVESFQVDS